MKTFNHGTNFPSNIQKEFVLAQSHLLPSENIRAALPVDNGFFILTDRRRAFLKHDQSYRYRIEQSIPLAYFESIESKNGKEYIIKFFNPHDNITGKSSDLRVHVVRFSKRLKSVPAREMQELLGCFTTELSKDIFVDADCDSNNALLMFYISLIKIYT